MDSVTARVEDVISSSREILKQFGLQQSEPSGVAETDVVVDNATVDATKVMLWPVYDLVAIRAELQLLAEFLLHDGIENGFRERVQGFLDFNLAHCPYTSPSHMLPWKQLLTSTDVKVIHEQMEVIYAAITTCRKSKEKMWTVN